MTSPAGGPAIPVTVDTTRAVQGGPAIAVYGYTAAPTDGRPALGGPAQPVRVLTAADLKQNGGTYYLDGSITALPVYTASAGMATLGGPAIPVYPINAWPTAATDSTPWYLQGSVPAANCLLAYQPKGAASLAASYDNIAAPGNGLADGTYDAALGVAPTFDATTGWTFNGTNQWLNTQLVPTAGGEWSAIILYSNVAAAGNNGTLFSSWKAGNPNNFMIYPSYADQVQYQHGGTLAVGPSLTNGVLGFAATKGYRNGVEEPGACEAWAGTTTFAIFIAALNNGGAPTTCLACKIQAFAVYNITLTPAQMSAITTAMQAL